MWQSFHFSGREQSYHFSGPSYDIWDRFYGNTTIDTVVNTSRRVTGDKNVFVDYVLFKNLSPLGAIWISNPTADTKALVSISSFYNISSTDNGGSIYYLSQGSFVQYKVCSYESKSTATYGVGSHSRIDVANADGHMNFAIESSFTHNTACFGILSHAHGFHLFSSINVSNSNLDANAALVSDSPASISTTNFSNFENLLANRICCFWHGLNKHNYYFCNIVNNKDLENERGIFSLSYDAVSYTHLTLPTM